MVPFAAGGESKSEDLSESEDLLGTANESCVHGVLVLALGDIAVVIDASVLNCVLSNLVPIHGLLCVWPRTALCT